MSHPLSWWGRRERRLRPRRLFLEPLEDRSLLAQVNAVWIGLAGLGGNGNWNVAANWDIGVVPNNGSPAGTTYAVTIDGGKLLPSNVSLDTSATIDSLTIDSDDSLTIQNNRSLTVVNSGAGTGTVDNKGKITLNTGGNNTDLIISGNVMLTGGGSVTLTDNGALTNRIIGTAATDRLTNVNNTISGSGRIGDNSMGLTNQGTIIANVTSKLIVDPSASADVTNTGTLRADGGVLQLDAGSFINTNGTIEALANSRIDVNGGIITSGKLKTTGNGNIRTTSPFTMLNSVFNEGNFEVIDNTEVTLRGTITNSGNIALNTGGNITDVRISGDVTLTGGGTVTMSDNGALTNKILGDTHTERLTNVNNTISGSGRIGDNFLALTNQGTIVANVTSKLIIDPLDAKDFTNTGTLRATNGGVLQLNPGDYLNTNGTLEALAGSRVDLNGSNIVGGFLQTTDTGVIRTTSLLTTLEGIFNLGTFQINDNTAATLVGMIVNAGNIAITTGGNTTDLKISETVTLSGGGTITMSDNGQLTNRIVGTTATAQLINSDNTISGSGRIGDNSLFLANSGTIVANVSSNLIIDPTGTAQSASPGMLNNGTLKAETGSTLVLVDGAFSQTEMGTINGGGTVKLTNSSVDGSGTVGNFTLDASAVLNVRLYGTADGAFDQLTVTGNVNLAGTLNTFFGFRPATGATFKIIDNKGGNAVNGKFAGLNDGDTFTSNGNIVRINYAAGDGNDVVLTVVQGTACTFVVTNTLDTGVGTLRDAIDCSNDNPGVDTIRFNIPAHPTDAISRWSAEKAANDSLDGNNGTLKNGAAFAPGVLGDAFDFTAPGSYVQVPDSPNLRLGSGAITLDAWVKASPSNLFRTIVGKFNPDFPYQDYELRINATNHAEFVATDCGTGACGGFTPVASSSLIADGNFHHVAGVRRASGDLEIYVDGVLENSLNQPLKNTDSSGSLNIGGPSDGNDFKGLVDEAEVYNRALSPSEINNIYQTDKAQIAPATPTPPVTLFRAEGNANDSIGSANGTLQGGATFAPGILGQAFSFDGTDDGFATASTTITNTLPLTIDAWVNPTLRTDGTDFPNNVFSNDVPGEFGNGFGVNVFPGGSQLKVEVDDGFREVPGVSFNAGQWYHVAVVYTPGNYKAYVDGQLVDDFDFAPGTANAQSVIRLGFHNDDDFAYGTRRFFKGLIDEAAAYNTALTSAQIQSLYAAGAVSQSLVRTISPTSGLPNITDPVIIDGYSQPGATPNTLAAGNNAQLLIELDGSKSGIPAGDVNGLVITGAAGTTVRGLVINRFGQAGIYADSAVTIEGNFIGTNPAGTAAAHNSDGVQIIGVDADSTIGGTTPAARNLISGNNGYGIYLLSKNTLVQGNYIGTNAAGTSAIANAIHGIIVGDGKSIGATIGGAAPGAGNLISGNTIAGIEIFSTAVVQGNLIGTNVTGSAALSNQIGIRIDSSGSLIGGTAAGAGNVIAFNTLDGVALPDGSGTDNSILRNSIFSNVGLGIDLNDDGPTANDLTPQPDVDSGPNNLQNFPEISYATRSGGQLKVTYKVPSGSASTYPLRVEFFKADANGQEGQIYLGFDTFEQTDFAAGEKMILLTTEAPIKVFDKIVATATDTLTADGHGASGGPGNTSEFSPSVTIVSPWQNLNKNRLRWDVNDDTFVSADDVLAVINYINAKGSGLLPDDAKNEKPYNDVDGDNNVVAADVIDIINYINAGRRLGGEAESEAGVASGQNSALMTLLAADLAAQSARKRRT
jgi:hypothetical protein